MSQSGTNANDSWCVELINVLVRQHDAVRELSELASRQADLIEAGRTDELLTLLGRRQELIDQFTVDQQSIGQYMETLDAKIDELDDGTRGRIRELLDGIGEGLEKVMQADARDQQSLKTAQQETHQDLSRLGNARQAQHAYVGSGGKDARRFPDRQG